MKKIIYLLMAVTVFASCNPLEDVNEIIDAIPNDPNIGSFEYTMVDEDYVSLGLKYPNFGTENEAKEKIPSFLASKYALYGKGSDVTVTFNIYAPKKSEKSLAIYSVTDQDYKDQGLKYPNFSKFDQITKFLNTKYPSAANRLLVNLTYKYYNGSVSTLNNGFIFVDGEWQMALGITDAEYTAMGEGKAQFSNKDEALTKIPVLLKEKTKYDGKVAGDIQGVMYKLYVKDTQDIDGDGKTDDKAVYSFVAYFIYDGANWAEYKNVINSTVKFANDGSTWVPDNTIRYTLKGTDYAYISTEFANVADYKEPAASLGQYNNFDRRKDKAAYWSEKMILTALNKLLDNVLAVNAEEGQKFVITYAIYDGNSGDEKINLIKKSGKWVAQ